MSIPSLRGPAAALGGALLVVLACRGELQTAGEVETGPLPAAAVVERSEQQEIGGRQILFGDLHVHTTFSNDAFLLSLPPMLLVAVSWMAGAWWAWDKGRNTFMVATMGAVPLRMFFVLGWAWLVISIPGLPGKVFLPALMLHWVAFTIPEIAMLLEFNRETTE